MRATTGREKQRKAKQKARVRLEETAVEGSSTHSGEGSSQTSLSPSLCHDAAANWLYMMMSLSPEGLCSRAPYTRGHVTQVGLATQAGFLHLSSMAAVE